MKAIVFVLIGVAISLNAEIVDLGKIGPTEKIIEEDLRVVAKRKLSKLKIKDIKKQLEKSVTKRATVKSELPSCMLDSQRVQKNITYLKNDHYDMGGELIFKKGEPQAQEFVMPASICVVDGSNMKLAGASLSRLLEVGKCNKVMVANADFRILENEMKEVGDFYPYNKELVDVMKIRCLPSRSEAYQADLTIDSFSIEGLL